MLSLRDADWAALRWTRARHLMKETLHTLRDGRGSEHEVATLRWVTVGAVHVETAEGRWTLTHQGLWVQRVDVEADATASGAASFSVKRDLRHRWRLALASGTAVRWHLAGLASADWVCDSETGERFMFLSVEAARAPARGDDPFNIQGRVALAAAVREWPEAALVLSLGWYLVLLGRTLARVRVPAEGD